MSRCHICNTFFEKELEKPSKKSLSQWMRSHPIVRQLQFLPLLYAQADDLILVSELPPNPDPRLHLIDQPPPISSIEHWGPSEAIAHWAQSHGLPYPAYNWDLIRQINSKVFSFTHSPRLPGAALLNTPEEAEEWFAATPGPKVLKTPFGTAANGHLRNVKPQYTTSKMRHLWGPLNANVKQLYIWPVIGEPWVERLQDFSTQWLDGKLLGVTLFENEPNGSYRGTRMGEVEKWALDEHLLHATPLVEKIAAMGYQGHLGVDAYIYLQNGERRVQPVVEINARKTMSWVALALRKTLYYIPSPTGKLPPISPKNILLCQDV